MRVYQCDCCNKVISNPHNVKMKEFYVGMMDIDSGSGLVIPIERKRKISAASDVYKRQGLHFIAERKERDTD